MREQGASSISGHSLLTCTCPFRDEAAPECEKVRAGEQRQRDDVRCDDARHSSCFYFFVLTNRLRDARVRAERPDAYHSGPGRIVCLQSPDEIRNAG